MLKTLACAAVMSLVVVGSSQAATWSINGKYVYNQPIKDPAHINASKFFVPSNVDGAPVGEVLDGDCIGG
jgi:hypothetical protein